uniref:Vesicle-fusing ATPase n=2 Tax=Meloidogyne incognita group TaxID=654580 RepID=A0A915MDW3_MELJA
MSTLKLRISKLPTTETSLTNKVYLNQSDLDAALTSYVRVITGPAHNYIFSFANHNGIQPGEIGFSLPQRRWTNVGLEQIVQVHPYSFPPGQQIITFINLTVDFMKKPANPTEPLDSDQMAREFLMQFANMAFTKDQELVFEFSQQRRGQQQNDKLPTVYTLKLFVRKMEGITFNSQPQECHFGPLSPNAVVIFDRSSEGSQLNLIGRSKGKSTHKALINPDWDFQQMGIGGLDKEFSDIFRRAFASRVFPPEFIEQLAMKHVRGILLFGPPGTGKTLIARQIGKMLNAREPKIVNGPEILDKFVGESESKMRKLFADAEEEWRRCGSNSGLHIIIFDEIDAICKQRGSMTGATGVHDTVVNQLLTKLDGVEQLNNILVIGMTNRKDMIDEALLRPGRIEVQLEISLPDENGRVQILKIHTARMREYNKLDPSVNIAELAHKTKNFSGAELEGLVRAAQSSAMNRLVKAGGKVQVDEDAVEKLMITSDDFEHALEHDVKPAFGHNDEDLGRLLYGGLICWGDSVTKVLDSGDLLIKETAAPDTRGFVRALLAGPANSGKTYLAAHIAKKSEFPFIKVCSPEDMVGYTESAKCSQLRKIFEDAYKSPLGCIIIDNIERLLDYSPIGPRYSNLVLQALLVLLGKRPPKNRRLLIIATTSTEHFLREANLLYSFSSIIHVECLTKPEHVCAVLEEIGGFESKEINCIKSKLINVKFSFGIKHMLEVLDFVKQGGREYQVDLLLESFEREELGI